MQPKHMKLELDQRTAGQLLASLAERLLRLESLGEDEVDEDAFADAKNDALALEPLYRSFRHQVLEAFGEQVLQYDARITELDELLADYLNDV